jgi:hypothetical protein
MVPVEGSYNSILASKSKTRPSGSRAAQAAYFDTVVAPIAVKVPVDGSYNSTVAEPPPAIRTLPS